MKKIAGPRGHAGWTPIRCRHAEHSPPTMISLPPGTYEHVCPSCKQRQVVTVRGAVLRRAV